MAWHSVEALAEAVMMHPFLYDKSHSHFHQKDIKKMHGECFSSKKSRFKAAILTQLCLYLITLIPELIFLHRCLVSDFFVRYYENLLANVNVSFRKLPTKLPRRLKF